MITTLPGCLNCKQINIESTFLTSVTDYEVYRYAINNRHFDYVYNVTRIYSC